MDDRKTTEVYTAYQLDSGIEEIMGDVSVSAVDAADNDGGIKGLLKKTTGRIVRPALFPVANRLTTTNYNTKKALIIMAQVIRDQQTQIDELYEALREQRREADE